MRDGTATRERLERCALTLFVQKGINATTIKDIANEAEIAEGTLYRHYTSKEALAHQLFVAPYTMMATELVNLTAACPTLEQKIKIIVYFFCEKYEQDPILFNYLLLAQHHQLRNIDEKEMSAHALLVPIFQEAIKKKEIKKRDPNLYAGIVLGVLLQAALSRVYGRITRAMTEDANDLLQILISALKA